MHRRGWVPAARSYAWMFGLVWLGFGFSYSYCIFFTQPAASPSPSSIYEYIIMFKIHKTHRYTYMYVHIPYRDWEYTRLYPIRCMGRRDLMFMNEWMNEWCGMFINVSLKLFFLHFHLPTDFLSHENIMIFLKEIDPFLGHTCIKCSVTDLFLNNSARSWWRIYLEVLSFPLTRQMAIPC